MKLYHNITLLLLLFVSPALVAQKEIRKHPDFVKTQEVSFKITGNNTTADMIQYYGIHGTRDFIRRENFTISYFNSDGSVKWTAELPEGLKLNTSEIIIQSDGEYIYAGLFSSFFGAKDRMVVLDLDGKIIKESRWDFPFNVLEKVTVFSDAEGFHILVLGGKGVQVKKDSKFYMITVKGDKITYKQNEYPSLKAMISPEIKSRFKKESFEELKLSFTPDSYGSFQADIPENNDPNLKGFMLPYRIYVADEETEDHLFTLYLEFVINGKGEIKKTKEFIIDSQDNGRDFITYNPSKKEYIYINHFEVEKKEPLKAEIRILDVNGKEKYRSLVEPAKKVAGTKSEKDFRKIGTIFTSGATRINFIGLTGGISAQLAVLTSRVNYDPFTKGYATWYNSNDYGNYCYVFSPDAKLVSMFTTKGYIPPVISGSTTDKWRVALMSADFTYIKSRKGNSMYEYMAKAPAKKARKVLHSTIPNADGSMWLIRDNGETGELTISIFE